MKKSFILYIDSLDIIDDLTDEQVSVLFRSIKKYVNNEKIEIKGMMNAIFKLFKNQIDRDNEKYEDICKARSVAGKRGGRQKKQIKAKEAIAFFDKQKKQIKAKEAHTDNDTDNVNDNDNDIYTHWNNKNIIHCQKLTGEIKTEIKKILKILTIEQVKKAIDIYSEVVLSEKTFFNYKWSLLEFLQRKNGCRVWHERVFDNYLKDINNINDQYRTIEI